MEDTTGEGGLKPGERVKVNRFVTKSMDGDGEITTIYHCETKAHNLFIDLLVSVGAARAVLYLWLLASSWLVTTRGSFAWLGIVGVVYIAYALTWFECAQYTHIAWWALAAGLALPRVRRGRRWFCSAH